MVVAGALACCVMPADSPAQVHRTKKLLPPSAAGSHYKNLKVLGAMPDNQFLPSMRLFTAALGVPCEFCHEENRASDNNAMKLVARSMITMTLQLNKTSFSAGTGVTCFTCHRGELVPARLQTLPAVVHRSDLAPTLPTPDDILAKYIAALGGEAAIRSIHSRSIIATQDIPYGKGGLQPVAAHVQMEDKAPNLHIAKYTTAELMICEGFDGHVAWSMAPDGAVTLLPQPFQMRAKRGADLFEPLDLKAEYLQMMTDSVESIHHRQAWVVLGFPPNDSPERLYFDVETGLLLRRQTVLSTMLGDLPFETDYEDYRLTPGGVRIPFKVTFRPASTRSALTSDSTLRIESVRENVPIDDKAFLKPASRPSPTPAVTH